MGDATFQKLMKSVSRGGSVHAEKSRDWKDLTLVVILI